MRHPALGVLLLFLLWGCTGDSARTVSGIYRAPAGEIQGLSVWIVDGSAVRRECYPEFVYGGNEQRYRFVPQGEIWVDQEIAAEEFRYTVAHEVRERSLMAAKGLSYADAHDSALSLERSMRLSDRDEARRHEGGLAAVPPLDCDGAKEIGSLPDSVRLRGIYRQYVGRRDSLEVWIVDGAAVRRDIFPDFGFSGNDMAYRFIPKGEIWIDAQTGCEELEFSIALEVAERGFMKEGMNYDDAYEKGLSVVAPLRRSALDASSSRPPVTVPTPPDREVGTGRSP